MVDGIEEQDFDAQVRMLPTSANEMYQQRLADKEAMERIGRLATDLFTQLNQTQRPQTSPVMSIVKPLENTVFKTDEVKKIEDVIEQVLEAVETPVPVVVEEIAQTVIEQTPEVVETPAPVVVEEIAQTVIEQAPEVVETPVPVVVEEIAQTVIEQTPEVVETPAPVVVEEIAQTVIEQAPEVVEIPMQAFVEEIVVEQVLDSTPEVVEEAMPEIVADEDFSHRLSHEQTNLMIESYRHQLKILSEAAMNEQQLLKTQEQHHILKQLNSNPHRIPSIENEKAERLARIAHLESEIQLVQKKILELQQTLQDIRG